MHLSHHRRIACGCCHHQHLMLVRLHDGRCVRYLLECTALACVCMQVRLNADTLTADGSASMAAVCAGSLALQAGALD